MLISRLLVLLGGWVYADSRLPQAVRVEYQNQQQLEQLRSLPGFQGID